MIESPKIKVLCDGDDCQESTVLVMCFPSDGGFSEEDIEDSLREDGWSLEGDVVTPESVVECQHYCPNCSCLRGDR